ncbi:F-box/kelch-repeat protein [Forsythia ovata]|uniref:F-box/kelch-repeat protein n=1 Tax=Forsythia ovata TaxID=205694 RepID=A0ABD1S8G6_9LAMI
MSDFLPKELIFEILLKLPVKSLLCFTTVCKLWHSLITSSEFIFSHLSISASKEDNTLFLRRYTKNDRAEHYTLLKDGENQTFELQSSLELHFPLKSQFGYFRIVGCSNGLVCLSDDFFTNPSQPIILWNPCIRKHMVLPAPTVKPEKAHFFVLGCGATRHDFKVVRMVYSKTNDFTLNLPAIVEIYSLTSGTWRRVHFDDRYVIMEFMWSQAFIEGTVHWLAFYSLEYPTQNQLFCNLILTFHMEDEVFGEIMLPDELAREAVTYLSITVIGKSLGAIKYDKQMGSESCCVWVMKEYGVMKSWTKLYDIDLVGGMEKVIRFRNNGGVLLASQEHELVTYNPETRVNKAIGIHGSPRSFYIDNYMESLVLLVGQNVVADEQLLTASSHISQSSKVVQEPEHNLMRRLAL